MRILMGSILNMDVDMNGVVTTAKEQQVILRRNQHDVRLITPYTYRQKSLLFFLLRASSVAFMRWGYSIFTLINLVLKGLILAHQTLKMRKNYDVFHAHDLISACVFLLISRTSTVTFLNAHFYMAPWDEFVEGGYIKKNDLSYHILKYLFVKTLSNTDLQLLPVSERNLRLLNKLLPKKQLRSVVLYPVVENKILEDKNIRNSSYLINVGSLNARKNQVGLIDILAELEALGVFCPLVLVGPEDPDEKNRVLDRISNLNLQSPVHFLGQKNSKYTQTLIQSALLYVHTAKTESFGRTLVEAMSVKTAVVAHEYEALHEILDEEAIIKSEWDACHAAAFLKTLIEDNSSREELQKSQYQKYLQSFTGEQLVSTYTNTFERFWRNT